MKSVTNFQGFKRMSIGVVLLSVIFTCSAISVADESSEETLARCETLAAEAYEMAFDAIATCDYHKAQHALGVVYDAAYLATQVSKEAQDTADTELAWKVYNSCNQVEAAIDNIVKAAKNIAIYSPHPDVIHAAKNLLDFCAASRKANSSIMEVAFITISGSPEKAEAYSK